MLLTNTIAKCDSSQLNPFVQSKSSQLKSIDSSKITIIQAHIRGYLARKKVLLQ